MDEKSTVFLTFDLDNDGNKVLLLDYDESNSEILGWTESLDRTCLSSVVNSAQGTVSRHQALLTLKDNLTDLGDWLVKLVNKTNVIIRVGDTELKFTGYTREEVIDLLKCVLKLLNDM